MQASPGTDYPPAMRRVTLEVVVAITDLDPHQDNRNPAARQAFKLVTDHIPDWESIAVIKVGEQEDADL